MQGTASFKQMLYTLKEVGEIVGKTYRAMIKEKQRGKIEFCTDENGRLWVRQDQLKRYLQRCKEQGRAANQSFGVEAYSREASYLASPAPSQWQQTSRSKGFNAKALNAHHDDASFGIVTLGREAS